MPDLDHRPCGACRAYVSTQDGCRHWKPSSRTGKQKGWVKGRARGFKTPPPAESLEVALSTIAVLQAGGLTDR